MWSLLASFVLPCFSSVAPSTLYSFQAKGFEWYTLLCPNGFEERTMSSSDCGSLGSAWVVKEYCSPCEEYGSPYTCATCEGTLPVGTLLPTSMQESCQDGVCQAVLDCPPGYELSSLHRMCVDPYYGAQCNSFGATFVAAQITSPSYPCTNEAEREQRDEHLCQTCTIAKATTTSFVGTGATTTSSVNTEATTSTQDFPSTTLDTTTTSRAITGSRSWELVGGPFNRACRGRTSTDNNPSYYDVVSGILSLEDCQAACLQQGRQCKGVEYSLGRCEVWHREEGIFAFAEPSVGTFTCMRYGWPAQYLIPMDGGVKRACRGDNPTDNNDNYYEVQEVLHLEDCKARCVAADICLGIEFKGHRCELWTRAILASAQVEGFTCLRYEAPARRLNPSHEEVFLVFP